MVYDNNGYATGVAVVTFKVCALAAVALLSNDNKTAPWYRARAFIRRRRLRSGDHLERIYRPRVLEDAILTRSTRDLRTVSMGK